MAKIQPKDFLLLRRSYAVATENKSIQPAATSMMTKVKDVRADGASEEQKKEIFWMKDPKTGNWIPENHFGDVDVADLREKVLSKKNNF